MRIIYLDNAATTKPYPEVVKVFSRSMESNFGNPSATYAIGRSSKAVLEDCRKRISKILHVSPTEIIFTSGATEANNLILQSLVINHGIEHIITSKIEHHAVLNVILYLEKRYHLKITFLPFLENGTIDATILESELDKNSIDPSKTLVSLMHVNNETGAILDLKKISDITRKYNVLWHSDMVQSMGYYPINFTETPVDFASASAHKFHGTKSVGFAYISKSTPLNPIFYGGEQERGVRPGTENISQVLAMTVALEKTYSELSKRKEFILDLKNQLVTLLTDQLPQVCFNVGSNASISHKYSILNIRLPILQENRKMLLFKLDMKGVQCSQGSACQSGSFKASHVLKEVLSLEDQKFVSLRISLSEMNSKQDIIDFVRILKEVLD